MPRQAPTIDDRGDEKAKEYREKIPQPQNSEAPTLITSLRATFLCAGNDATLVVAGRAAIARERDRPQGVLSPFGPRGCAGAQHPAGLRAVVARGVCPGHPGESDAHRYRARACSPARLPDERIVAHRFHRRHATTRKREDDDDQDVSRMARRHADRERVGAVPFPRTRARTNARRTSA